MENNLWPIEQFRSYVDAVFKNCGRAFAAAEREVLEKLEEMLPYRQRPSAPKLAPNHTVEEAKTYATKLESYTTEMESWKNYRDVRNFYSKCVDEKVVEAIKREANFDIVPEKYRDKAYAYAYERGHSGGYNEVFNVLLDLVAIFE